MYALVSQQRGEADIPFFQYLWGANELSSLLIQINL